MSIIDAAKGLSKDTQIYILRTELEMAKDLSSEVRKTCEVLQSHIDSLQAERNNLAANIETALKHVADGPAHDLLSAIADGLRPPSAGGATSFH
ncbi:hypothetical protein AFCDBAGC_5047 [Methylobacterium cerastii]|uniref:Uncharacterized protein n=1 Tax=Methylobacterium cerastii TaxID=932741 RepID=A0ABQ4QPD5_9HYPH|nr:hypothetical protein [Methylobacterium cerastii]GJD47161.1 hypothetical protein AFCDBAGC_5047 [Methylobacterium cerastii]